MKTRRALAIAGLAALLGAVARPARAEEPPPAEVRARRELAFVVNRVGDLDAFRAGGAGAADLEPLFVRDGIWRPIPALPPAPPEDGSLSSRRIRWIVDEYRTGKASLGAYPVAKPGETDLYPTITAIVRDRARRESVGLAGLPAASPLAGYPEPTLQWIEKAYTVPTFTGAPRPDESEEDLKKQREDAARVAERADRNRLTALAAVGGLAVLTLAVGVVLSLARKRRGPSTDL